MASPMATLSALPQYDFDGALSDVPEPAQGLRFFLWLRMVTIIAVVFTLGNALWAAWDQGLTYDEFYHLEWPRRLLYERLDERDSAFRFDSKTPVLLPAVLTVDGLRGMGIGSEQGLRFAARLTPIAYLGLCLGLVAALARYANSEAAWMAVLLAALDPNLAASASVATSDVAYTMAVLLAAWAMVRATASWTSELIIGAAIGLSFAVKYTAVLLVPVALLYVAWHRRDSPRSALLRLGVMAGASCLTANALYLLVGVWAPLGSLAFRTPVLQNLSEILPSFRLPFPRSVLTGIDISMDHDAHTNWSCYLLGQTHPGGVWYYFVAHWLMKTPVALGLAVVAGVWLMRTAWRERLVVVLGVLFGIHLIYFSFFFSTQIGFRYTLPCVLLASTLAAIGLARAPTRYAWWLVPMAAFAMAERLPYWGDPIAFTNLSVWPKSRAYRYTADSNLDYGQNRERLARYVKESRLAAIVDQATVTPGLYVINANDLTIFGNFRANRWLIARDIPVVNLGFTHFGFSITGELFEAYMNETRVVPSVTSFGDVCAGELPHYPPGSKIPFTRNDHPDRGRLWVICAYSKKGVDLGFRVQEGRLYFGSVVSRGRCSTEFLQANQMTWVRVPPGGRVQLCIREIPFRRSFLPYLVDGYLTVRGQGADVEFRPVPPDSLSTPDGQDAVR